MLGAIEIDDPEIGDAAVGRDVRGLADVDDALAVGRDLRIRSDLDTENIHGFEAIGDFLSDGGGREEKKRGDCGDEKEFLGHDGLLLRMHVKSEIGGKSMEVDRFTGSTLTGLLMEGRNTVGPGWTCRAMQTPRGAARAAVWERVRMWLRPGWGWRPC